MNFRHIEAFITVYRLRNFSRAGDALYLTQSTISSSIKYLEKYLGVDLFDRSNNEVIPTGAGDDFYHYAVNLIETRDCAISSLNQYKNKIEGRLEIVASTIPSQYLLPRILKGFRELHPDVRFTLFQRDTREAIREIQDKKYQIGIVGTRIDDDKLDYQKIASDELVMITGDKGADNSITDIKNNNGMENNTSVELKELLDKPLILREQGSGTRREFEKALLKKGVNLGELKVVAEMNSNEAIKIAVREGLGCSVISSVSVTDYLGLGLIKAYTIKDLDLTRSFYLVTYKNRPLSPCAAAFRKYVIENID